MSGKPQIARDLSGQKFGRLTAISFQRRKFERMWLCNCECGTVGKAIRERSLLCGRTSSCGCLARERAAKSRQTHGFGKHPLFNIWKSMMARCYNPTSNSHKFYASHGITVCERWHSIENFIADIGERPEGLTLDRIDNDKGYEPGNMRWTTKTEQSRNRRKTVWVDWKGDRRRLCDLADEAGQPICLVRQRIVRRGWSVERALREPVIVREKAAP